jgi:hypothetical protein
MNQPGDWNSAIRSAALVTITPKLLPIKDSPHTSCNRADSIGRSAGSPSSPSTRANAVASNFGANSADLKDKEDRDAVEAWENEGDPN